MADNPVADSKNALAKKLANLSPQQRQALLNKLQKEKVRNTTAERRSEAIVKVPHQGDLRPLSSSQQRLWFLDQLAPGSVAYNMSAILELRGGVDVATLQLALRQLVQRHEVLRYQFVASDRGAISGAISGAMARVAPLKNWSLGIDDLSMAVTATHSTLADQSVRQFMQQPFDLTHDILLRAQLLRFETGHHWLLISMHHIAADGWSIQILQRELATLYRSMGNPDVLAPLPIQYADYAHWQQQSMQREDYRQRLQAYAHTLQDVPETALPYDHRRPTMVSHQGRHLVIDLAAAPVNRLMQLARDQGVTPFAIFLTLYCLLLARYGGSRDVCVGTAVANRERPELQSLMGFLVNTVALRLQWQPDVSFLDLLQSLQRQLSATLARADIPFEQLVETLGGQRDVGRNPLFQTLFTYTSGSPYQVFDLAGGLTAQFRPLETQTAKFDLTFSLLEDAGAVQLEIEYRVDLFEPCTIDRMAGHYQQLMASALADPHGAVGRLSVLTAAEQQALQRWSCPQVEPLPSLSIAQAFEQQVGVAPDRPALALDGSLLTYSQLNQLANHIAWQLIQEHGVQPGQIIAVCAQRSFAMVAALLAISKVGGAYLSLDPDYPPQRLLYMLEDSQTRLVLGQRSLRPRLPELTAAFVELPELTTGVAEALENPSVDFTPQQAAYVIYTSGTTGQPKGVLNSHQSVVRLVCHNRFAGFVADSSWLQFATTSFDAAVFEIWAPLLNGARLVLAAPGQKDLAYLARLIEDESIDHVFLTTSLFHLMVDEYADALVGVRRLITGGDVMSSAHAQRARQLLPACRITNAYGPSENGVISTVYDVEDSGTEPSVPIGQPIDHGQVWILDDQLQPVPIGVKGELYLLGTGLSEGYWRRPDLTEKAFVSVAVAGVSHRAYRSGDQASWRADGQLLFHGRGDQQVKWRGFRIELAEIENQIKRCDGVRDCLVICDEDGASKQLLAYVVEDLAVLEDSGVESLDLKVWLRGRLPDFMLPSHVIPVLAWPLTANGKLDRAQLPKPRLPKLCNQQPRTDVEWQVAEIWQQVLDLPQVGIHDDFFDIGGHSLLATQIQSRLRHAYQLELSLQTLFEVTTVAGLAQLLTSLTQAQGVSEDDEAFEEGVL